MRFSALISGLVVCLGSAMAPSLARAATSINVTLQDPTDPGVDGMKMTATPDKVKAGPVVIHAVNQSKGGMHEVVVLGGGATPDHLPYDPVKGQVIESQTTDLGEVPDLGPGKSGTLDLTLKPGTYLLICNQPGHFRAGMWTRLIVTP